MPKRRRAYDDHGAFERITVLERDFEPSTFEVIVGTEARPMHVIWDGAVEDDGRITIVSTGNPDR